MKLLVCDIEGTIFQPHMIKDAQHASYIWTAIAGELGQDAERAEISTQKKWRSSGYGAYDAGVAYMRWVNESIKIHRKYGLKETVFNRLIDTAPYVIGVKPFFKRLNRKEYIPILISGGIQNLNHKACRDLDIDPDDSYASCEYFFKSTGELDASLTFQNTCNFYGKHELIDVALKKHGLGPKNWVFIGDGINDIEVAKSAPLSIGIDPISELKAVAHYSFSNFAQLSHDKDFVEKNHFFDCSSPQQSAEASPKKNISAKEQSIARVAKQIGNLPLEDLEKSALEKYRREADDQNADTHKGRFWGVRDLLEHGEYVLTLLEAAGEEQIVSAVLQPFCNASEIMVNMTLALTEESETLHDLINAECTFNGSIDHIENPRLKDVLHAYRKIRNAVAHSYQVIPIKAARSLARRTYENIQRLELIINSQSDY